MADFRPIAGETRSTHLSAIASFTLEPGAVADIALWGGGPGGETLTLVSLKSRRVTRAWTLAAVAAQKKSATT
jgi:hypothetical protein